MWILLWIIVAIIILGATGWSTIILIQQKKAWEAYAKKNGLKFIKSKFFQPPEMNGVINDYQVAFFTAEQQEVDDRNNRLLTVVQITADENMVDGFAAVSPIMKPFLESLEAVKPHKLKSKGWDPKNFVSSRNKARVDAYMTEERLKAITSLLNMKNANVLVLSDETESIIRIETSNPLQQEELINKFMERVFARFEVLKVKADERKMLEAIKAKAVQEVVEETDDETEEVEVEDIVETEEPEIIEPIAKPKPKKVKKKAKEAPVKKKKEPLEPNVVKEKPVKDAAPNMSKDED